MDDAEYDENTYLLGIGALAVMRSLRDKESAEGHEERAAKMSRVADESAAKLEKVRSTGLVGKAGFAALLQMLPNQKDARWDRKERTVFMIELVTSTPFAPYQLKYNEDGFRDALTAIGERVGVDSDGVKWIQRWYRDAQGTHKDFDFGRVAIVGAVAAVATVATAGLAAAAAPLVAPLFAVAGLSGSAAFLSGMAAIGFGSIASGGLGVAGGMWILTGAGAALGATLSGGAVGAAAALGAFDSSTALTQIVKAQVAFKVVYVDGLADAADGTVGVALDRMVKERADAHKRLESAKQHNEDDALMVKDVQKVITGLDRAIKWMNKRVEDAEKERSPLGASSF